MHALFAYGFLQRAFLAGVFVAVACAVLGVFLVLRKDAMIGHGLSHIAFAGVALGLFLNVLPLAAALAVSVAAALAMVKLKDRAGLHGDTAIGIFSSLGLAVGILLASLARGFNVELMSYLFGDVLAIEPLEVWLSVGLAAAVLGAVRLNYGKLLFMTFDRESARAAGIKVGRLDALLMVLTAVTVVLGMKVAGILLVAALVVIPAAAGLQAAASFRTAIAASALVAVVAVAGGLAASLALNIPASAAIVALCFLAFVLLFLLKKGRSGPQAGA
ncbi:MAG TPA: metal ABC transporter permease [Candidatus Aminicenantes bacterium]|nr:metal ABC transporter permease [Candidatus Aminicenantes bacterium]HRY65219.1 metal ABC transporter permease [Candidatus Aminicenantes bacterium]HRZ72313.1 metal ABC transporter permease [Candidatus Aminicenantes bacterium]